MIWNNPQITLMEVRQSWRNGLIYPVNPYENEITTTQQSNAENICDSLDEHNEINSILLACNVPRCKLYK